MLASPAGMSEAESIQSIGASARAAPSDERGVQQHLHGNRGNAEPLLHRLALPLQRETAPACTARITTNSTNAIAAA